MDIFKIILLVIIIISLILIGYAFIYNKIKTEILKINSAESEIDELLRIKYDIITKVISEIKLIDKNNKDFKNVEKIKDEELSSFEFERKLKDIESQIYTLKSDNTKIQKSSTINDLWYENTSIDTKIKATEKYYNQSVTLYNNLVTKFPSKIIALILRYKEKTYFDGKDMYDENIKDFKI